MGCCVGWVPATTNRPGRVSARLGCPSVLAEDQRVDDPVSGVANHLAATAATADGFGAVTLGPPASAAAQDVRGVAAAGKDRSSRQTAHMAVDRRATQHRRGLRGRVAPVPGCFGVAVVGSFDVGTIGATRYPRRRVGCGVSFVAFHRAGESRALRGCLSGQQRQLV